MFKGLGRQMSERRPLSASRRWDLKLLRDPFAARAGGVVFFFGWHVIEMHENCVVAPHLVWTDDRYLATHLVLSVSADKPLLFVLKHLQQVTHTCFQGQELAPSLHQSFVPACNGVSP